MVNCVNHVWVHVRYMYIFPHSLLRSGTDTLSVEYLVASDHLGAHLKQISDIIMIMIMIIMIVIIIIIMMIIILMILLLLLLLLLLLQLQLQLQLPLLLLLLLLLLLRLVMIIIMIIIVIVMIMILILTVMTNTGKHHNTSIPLHQITSAPTSSRSATSETNIHKQAHKL